MKTSFEIFKEVTGHDFTLKKSASAFFALNEHVQLNHFECH